MSERNYQADDRESVTKLANRIGAIGISFSDDLDPVGRRLSYRFTIPGIGVFADVIVSTQDALANSTKAITVAMHVQLLHLIANDVSPVAG